MSNCFAVDDEYCELRCWPAYGTFFLRKVSLRADVSGVAAGNCVVAFADPTVPLVAARSSGLNVTFLGSVHAIAKQKIIRISSLMLSAVQTLC